MTKKEYVVDNWKQEYSLIQLYQKLGDNHDFYKFRKIYIVRLIYKTYRQKLKQLEKNPQTNKREIEILRLETLFLRKYIKLKSTKK